MSTSDELANQQPAEETPAVVKEEKKENGIKRFGSYIPQLSIMIVTLGIIKQIIYYKNYNLPIKYFLGLSELGLIISDDLIFIIPVVIFSIGVLYLVKEVIRTRKNRASKNPIENNVIISKGRFILDVSILIIFSIAIIYVHATKIYEISRATTYSEQLKLTMDILAADIGLLIGIFLSRITRIYTKNINIITNYFLLVFLVMMVSFIVITAISDIKNVEQGKYKGTIITTADSSYTSTDSSYFIGKTEKYVFIYNKRDTTTTILPTDEIKKMILKEK